LRASLFEPAKFNATILAQIAGMTKLFEVRLNAHVTRVSNMFLGGLADQLPREFLTALYKVPVGIGGFSIPKHVEADDLPAEASNQQILMEASKMLYIKGWDYQISSPLDDFQLDKQMRMKLIQATRPSVSKGYRKVIAQSFDFYGLSSLHGDLDFDEPDDPAEFLIGELTKRFNRFRIEIVKQFEYEAVRVQENLKLLISRRLGNCYVGYVLRSRFLPTSDPVHEANDSNEYYIDSRPGSAAPWEERLVAPYRKNCVCFHDAIFEIPNDDLETIDFTAFNRAALLDFEDRLDQSSSPNRLITNQCQGLILVEGKTRRINESDVGTARGANSDHRMVLARDPFKFGKWFNRQHGNVKAYFVGRPWVEALPNCNWFEIRNPKGGFRKLEAVNTDTRRSTALGETVKFLRAQSKRIRCNQAVEIPDSQESLNFKLIDTHFKGLGAN